jgi:hypothetical protein
MEDIQKDTNIDNDQEQVLETDTELKQQQVKKAIAYIDAKGGDKGDQRLIQTVLRAMISIGTAGGKIDNQDTIESMISAMEKDNSSEDSGDREDR